jgi:hypothetical protein
MVGAVILQHEADELGDAERWSVLSCQVTQPTLHRDGHVDVDRLPWAIWERWSSCHSGQIMVYNGEFVKPPSANYQK